MYTDWYREALEDAGGPTTQLLGDTRPKARKDHDCSSCRRGIKKGQFYRRRFWLVDGEPTTEKTCQECLADEYGGY